jgi:hypothetical protein
MHRDILINFVMALLPWMSRKNKQKMLLIESPKITPLGNSKSNKMDLVIMQEGINILGKIIIHHNRNPTINQAYIIYLHLHKCNHKWWPYQLLIQLWQELNLLSHIIEWPLTTITLNNLKMIKAKYMGKKKIESWLGSCG